jgi:hypothetical protein
VSFSARVHTSPPGFEPGSLGREPRILTSKTIADSAKVAANFCTRRRIPKLARHSSLGPWRQHGQERAATVAAAPWRHIVSTVWFHLVGERRTGLKTQFGATVEGCPLRGTGEAGTAKPRGTTRGHPASDLASALPRDQHGPSIRTDPALDPAAARTRRQHVHRGQQPRHRGAWATLNSEGTWRCGITPAQHAGSRGKPLDVHCERMRKQVCLCFFCFVSCVC